jgi:hypothetical protein
MFSAFSVDELLAHIQKYAPNMPLNEDILAFLQVFGNRLLGERNEKLSA